MRYILTLLTLISVGAAQDTLITNAGVTYLGKFVEETDTHVMFQIEGMLRPQPMPYDKILRIGMYDGVSKPKSADNMDSFSNSGEEGDRPYERPRMGIKGGLSISKFIGHDAKLEEMESGDPQYVSSYSIGVFAVFKINDRFAIQPEILYTIKGNMYDISSSESEDGFEQEIDYTTEMKAQWIEIPMLGVFQLSPKFHLLVGPYFEYFLGGESKLDYSIRMTFDGESYSDSGSDRMDIEKDDLANFGYGLVFGSGFNITPALGIDARYSMGLSTIDKEPEDYDNEEDYEIDDVRNSGIQLLLTYSF